MQQLAAGRLGGLGLPEAASFNRTPDQPVVAGLFQGVPHLHRRDGGPAMGGGSQAFLDQGRGHQGPGSVMDRHHRDFRRQGGEAGRHRFLAGSAAGYHQRLESGQVAGEQFPGFVQPGGRNDHHDAG